MNVSIGEDIYNCCDEQLVKINDVNVREGDIVVETNANEHPRLNFNH